MKTIIFIIMTLGITASLNAETNPFYRSPFQNNETSYLSKILGILKSIEVSEVKLLKGKFSEVLDPNGTSVLLIENELESTNPPSLLIYLNYDGENGRALSNGVYISATRTSESFKVFYTILDDDGSKLSQGEYVFSVGEAKEVEMFVTGPITGLNGSDASVQVSEFFWIIKL